jgi:phosphoribosylamine---glycine ligase
VVAMGEFPYDYKNRKYSCGFPVWGMNVKNRYNIHPCDMMLGEALGDKGMEPMMVSAGNYLMVVSGTGETVREAKDEAYKVIKQLEVPNNPIYRIDIGERLETQISELQKMGFATMWEW